MEGVESYLKTLSSEEREKHSELIEECRNREIDLLKNRDNAYRDAERLGSLTKDLLEGINTICINTQKLKNSYLKLKKNSLSIILETIPDDRFFNS